MENNDNKVISPISNEIVKLRVKNLQEDVRCNKKDSVFSVSTSIKVENPKELDVYSSSESIREEYSDPDDVFIENMASNCSILKIKPEKDEQTIKFLGNASEDVKCMLDPSFVDLDKFNIPLAYNEWKIKNEEVDIKDEDVEQTKTRILDYCLSQQNHNESVVENGRQEIPKRNCKQKSVFRGSLNKNINMFKCDECSFLTLHKISLKVHLLRHKNPEDVDMFKCDQCDFQTLQKGNLKSHLLKHKNPEDVETFKCDQCNFQTLHKSNIKRHLLVHKNPEDVNKFKCDQCDFQTLRKSYLKIHLLRHRIPEDVDMFKCDKCNYKSLQKSYLRRHLLRHKNP